MDVRPGDKVLVTGASRGLGVHIAEAFARRGAHVILCARSADALGDVAVQLTERHGSVVTPIVADLGTRVGVTSLLDRVYDTVGGVDVLVNNAGVDTTRRYDERSVDEIAAMVELNLLAPMLLTRATLPRMIERGRGHVVNIASIGGLLGSAYEEPYNATKFGMVGFTRSLRLSARDCGWPVSSSVVCPGFMSDDGMFAQMQSEFGARAPGAMAPLPADRIGAAVIKAVERDLPEVLLMRGAPRLALTASAAMPRLFEHIVDRLDLAAPFRQIARQRNGR